MSGLMSVTGDPNGGEPVKAGTPVCDMGAGMYGALGIVSALCTAKERTRPAGRGDPARHPDLLAHLAGR